MPSPSALAVLTQAGAKLPIEALSLDTAAGAGAISLAPGTRVTLSLSWQNWCGRRAGPLRIQLTFADRDTATGSFDGPPDYNFWPGCVTSGKYSMLQVLYPYALG